MGAAPRPARHAGTLAPDRGPATAPSPHRTAPRGRAVAIVAHMTHVEQQDPRTKDNNTGEQDGSQRVTSQDDHAMVEHSCHRMSGEIFFGGGPCSLNAALVLPVLTATEPPTRVP